MEPYQLSKKEVADMNRALAECNLIKQDLERARQAGVPNVEHIEEAVSVCEDRINKLKSIYASRRK
jgi:hypothetical protein